MAWKRLDRVVEGVIRDAEIAAAGSVEALNPSRGIGGDELLREECDSPSPMRVSGGVPAQSEFETDRDALEGCEPRPGQPAFLLANRVDANRSMATVSRRRPAKNRPRGSAVVIDMFVWKRDHAALRSMID